MALRSLARKLRVPATAAIQQASVPRMSPAAGSRLLASPSSQNGEAKKALNGTKDLDEIRKEAMRDFEEASRAVNMVPKVCLLSAALGILLGPCAAAYLFSGSAGNGKHLF
uniref:Uncharacterized protein n=1 Tax=Arundo donax TaxID=35708 RepID=A0A0A9BWT5_ARUDO